MVLDSIQLTTIGSILSESGRELLGTNPTNPSKKLLTFEEINQNSGFVLYETTLPKLTRDPSLLTINGLHDRAQVYLDEVSRTSITDHICALISITSLSTDLLCHSFMSVHLRARMPSTNCR